MFSKEDKKANLLTFLPLQYSFASYVYVHGMAKVYIYFWLR